MADNLLYATESIRSSVTSLKKKLSNIKISIELLDSELGKVEAKFDKLLIQSDIYKTRIERESNRQVRKLEVELERLRKLVNTGVTVSSPDISESEIKIASTVAIFESILRNMCDGAEDFKLMCYSFIFPAVYERIIREDESLYLKKVPSSAELVIRRGRQYISHIRSVCETHVTDPEAWDLCIGDVTDWLRNDSLPLLYGYRHEEWDSDVPLALPEIMMWKEEPAERPIHFSDVFDVFELYREHKEAVFESSGVRAFDLKLFNFESTLP